jgi:signal peptidase
MYPTFNPGDLIIDKDIYTDNEAKDELVKGDIITYWTNINGERVLNTHRSENVYDGGNGRRIFETKGDNNIITDRVTVGEAEVVGVYKAKIPGVGKVLDYLQTSTGFLLIVVIPVFIFFIYHLVQFFRVLFEYQNIKNRIKFEQERDQADAVAAERKADDERRTQERAQMEAELREKLRAEILESMAKEKEAEAAEDK